MTKQMPIFEEVCVKVLQQPGFWLKVLVGGLLSFVPGLNIFAFGFLYRLSQSLQKRGSVALPDWSDWSGLFRDGLQFAVVWLAYWLLPLLLALALFAVLGSIGLGALAYLVLSLVFVLSPVLFGAALYRYLSHGDFKDLLDVPLIFRMAYLAFPRQIVPAFFFFGVFALCPPLYGFTLFFGFTLLIIQTTLSYRSVDPTRAIGL
jgi:hypothetical protein